MAQEKHLIIQSDVADHEYIIFFFTFLKHNLTFIIQPRSKFDLVNSYGCVMNKGHDHLQKHEKI